MTDEEYRDKIAEMKDEFTTLAEKYMQEFEATGMPFKRASDALVSAAMQPIAMALFARDDRDIAMAQMPGYLEACVDAMRTGMVEYLARKPN